MPAKPSTSPLTAIGVFQYLVVLALTSLVIIAILYLFGNKITVAFSAPLTP